jgi:hypothetical protein
MRLAPEGTMINCRHSVLKSFRKLQNISKLFANATGFTNPALPLAECSQRQSRV